MRLGRAAAASGAWRCAARRSSLLDGHDRYGLPGAACALRMQSRPQTASKAVPAVMQPRAQASRLEGAARSATQSNAPPMPAL